MFAYARLCRELVLLVTGNAPGTFASMLLLNIRSSCSSLLGIRTEPLEAKQLTEQAAERPTGAGAGAGAAWHPVSAARRH